MAVDKHARFTALRQQAAQVLADGGTSLDAGSLNTTRPAAPRLQQMVIRAK